MYHLTNVLADDGRWDDLLAFAADPAGAAGERRHVAHVVALEAPPPFAVAAAELFPDGRGHIGPLWDVVASRNEWCALAPHLSDPGVRRLVAQTRVLRGEDLSAEDADDADPPLRLREWEAARWDPERDMWSYDRNGCTGATMWAFPGPLVPPSVSPATGRPPVEHAAVALLDGLSPVVRAHAVRGPVRRGTTAWFADAYPHLVQVATGERAAGRGTGHALARIALWRALAASAGARDAVDAFVERLRCVTWRRPEDVMYHLRLVLEDPTTGIAFVLTGTDRD
ncbi:hypothetical protein Val02_35920 [Virgisporangium aliadipatigenens]|uniref:Uncharacterized protein n=1 Tax=Virgisporangium aliadipatigenens TaxID=741659 RepID=A0A8J4DR51_9ACTN|nr:hypothetical protein [Virgisporangium aliadipatigenens]GIJ46706.1 hypothetical protein Val02_35920 [Virgisporangium aliadipatigenens]